MKIQYWNHRGWKYQVRELLGSYKAFYCTNGNTVWHSCQGFLLRSNEQEAQADLDRYAKIHGFTKEVSD